MALVLDGEVGGTGARRGGRHEYEGVRRTSDTGGNTGTRYTEIMKQRAVLFDAVREPLLRIVIRRSKLTGLKVP